MTTEPTGPLYPEVVVQLSGEGGNSMFIIARVTRAMRKAGLDTEEINRFGFEAIGSPGYDAFLQTVMRWVTTR
jgi:hypothetical protein